jgi:hypothetical protein
MMGVRGVWVWLIALSGRVKGAPPFEEPVLEFRFQVVCT